MRRNKMINKIYYELTGDCEVSDLCIRFTEGRIKEARDKEAEWKKEKEIFNVALWIVTVTVTKEII